MRNKFKIMFWILAVFSVFVFLMGIGMKVSGGLSWPRYFSSYLLNDFIRVVWLYLIWKLSISYERGEELNNKLAECIINTEIMIKKSEIEINKHGSV